jgi:hypothetical protein
MLDKKQMTIGEKKWVAEWFKVPLHRRKSCALKLFPWVRIPPHS